MTRYLYALAIPEDASQTPRASSALRLASNSPLNSDTPDVDPLATEPRSRSLDGVFAGKFAGLQASELQELFAASNMGVVPWYGDESDQRDGYMALQDVNLRRARPDEQRLQRFDGGLERAGTRDSHRRTVATNPQSVDNAFGSVSAAEVGLSAAATNVEWWDKTDGTHTSATVQRTVTGEHGDINIYDATEPSFSQPVLLHDIAYEDEWPTDARVWDDYNRSKTATAADGTTIDSVWQRCFVSSHEFEGAPVVESDRLRLEFDVDNQTLNASRWSSSNSQYQSVSLGSSSYSLKAISITRIGQARVEARTRWSDGSSTQALSMTLRRGADNALFTTPPNESSPPQDVINLLSPIAADEGQTAAESVAIRPRTEVDI